MFGASFDTPVDNRAFRDAQGFTYPLLSDVERNVGGDYQVVRAPDHKYADYPERHSYLIDPSGMIAAAFDVTDLAGHAAEVLSYLRDHPWSE